MTDHINKSYQQTIKKKGKEDILDCASPGQERRVSSQHVLLNATSSPVQKYRRDCERSFLLIIYVTFAEGNSYLPILLYIEIFLSKILLNDILIQAVRVCKKFFNYEIYIFLIKILSLPSIKLIIDSLRERGRRYKSCNNLEFRNCKYEFAPWHAFA